MAINFGGEQKQKEGGQGPIPKGSKVKVALTIREPKEGKADPQDGTVTVFKSGLKGLDLEFEVIGGSFEGKTIWENWFLPVGFQTVALTKGQTGACNGSGAKMRAAVEATRNIHPDDPAGNRSIESWYDLDGLEFAVKVGIETPKPGDKYINNNILKVLSIDDEDFATVMAGGEVLTDVPIPSLPEAPAAATPQAAAPAWAPPTTKAPAAPTAPTTPQAPATQPNRPAWARK